MAAISEMLLQSYIPGHLFILPALPQQLADKGLYRGLRVRGGGRVGVNWLDGGTRIVAVSYEKYHPWLGGLREESPGFFK